MSRSCLFSTWGNQWFPSHYAGVKEAWNHLSHYEIWDPLPVPRVFLQCQGQSDIVNLFGCVTNQACLINPASLASILTITAPAQVSKYFPVPWYSDSLDRLVCLPSTPRCPPCHATTHIRWVFALLSSFSCPCHRQEIQCGCASCASAPSSLTAQASTKDTIFVCYNLQLAVFGSNMIYLSCQLQLRVNEYLWMFSDTTKLLVLKSGSMSGTNMFQISQHAYVHLQNTRLCLSWQHMTPPLTDCAMLTSSSSDLCKAHPVLGVNTHVSPCFPALLAEMSPSHVSNDIHDSCLVHSYFCNSRISYEIHFHHKKCILLTCEGLGTDLPGQMLLLPSNPFKRHQLTFLMPLKLVCRFFYCN